MKHVGLMALGGAGWMGGANYIRGLAAAIRAASPATRISYLCPRHLLEDWREDHPLIPIATQRTLRGWLSDRTLTLRAAVARGGVDFLYPVSYASDFFSDPPFWLSPQLDPRGWAGWVPDFQHRHLPGFFTEKDIAWREERIALLAEKAPRVVLSSESAALDFRDFYPAHSAKAQVLTFATPPLELCEDALAMDGISPRFLLVCNQFWKHKNHAVILDALRILTARGIRPVVFCTGELVDHRDAAYAETIRAALRTEGLGEQVKLLGLIPREQQIALMRRAVAIIQPSLFEGWSTIVEDARTLGRPSLLSSIAVHREQNPSGARFFDPHSPEALADLIAEAWADWPAGPDRAAEKAAHDRAVQRLSEVGSRFLALAETCR
ncbi:MAG: glycosyltransferase family 1 protein [Chthoniobacteraceae bacterium]